MKYKKKRLFLVLNILLSTYFILNSIELKKLDNLKSLVKNGTQSFYERSYRELEDLCIRDFNVIFSPRDKFFRVFEKDLVDLPKPNTVIIAKRNKRKFSYYYVLNKSDLKNFVDMDKNNLYIIESVNLIKVIRYLEDRSKTFYFYEDLFGILEKAYLKTFFGAIYKLLTDGFSFQHGNFSASIYDIEVEIVKKKLTKTYYINFKQISQFSQTVYVGRKSSQEFLVYRDLERIFCADITKINRLTNKFEWLEYHIHRILGYLYEKKIILTKDVYLYPDLVSCLFPFKFLSLSNRFFKPNEVVTSGICFSKVLKAKNLHKIINFSFFEHSECVFGNIRFTKFV